MGQLIDKNTRIWFDATLLSEDPALCFDIAFWEARNGVTGSAKGRGTTWFVKTGTLPCALRHYHRGGLFGQCVRDHYVFTGWQRTRSQQEFALLSYLREKGVAVPRPIAARAIKRTFCYQADLLVEKIEGARSLVDLLQSEPLSAAQYYKVGQLIKSLHDAGVSHTDLNIHNILIDATDTFWLIDFDKCGQRRGERFKAANLRRLLRSFKKEVLKRNIHWKHSDWPALLKGYNKAK